MNAPFRTTTTDLANALMGRPRQDVRVCSSEFNGGTTRYVVSVNRELYEVYGFTLRALQNGFSPEELELEPYDEDEDRDEPDGDFCMNTGVYPRASGWRR